MDIKPIKFLNEKDLSYLDVYEYHGGEYTYLDNFLNPFWARVANWFPNWFAPNLITLTGLIINIIAAGLVALYDPMMLGEAPGWIYINAAICLQVYAVLDAADGKQARRLNASSPLGQIFDHGCDAVNLIFIIMSSISGMGLQVGKVTSWIIISMSSTFAIAQLIEYQSNVLLTGNKVFGVTETMLIVSCLLTSSAIFGVDIWNANICDYLPFLKQYTEFIPIKYFGAILLLVVVISIASFYVLQSLIVSSPIPEEKRGNKNVDRLSYIIRFIPVILIGFCGYYLLNSDIMNEYALYIYFLVGLTYSFLSVRINISHLCRRKLTYKFAGMYPLILVTLNHKFAIVADSIAVPVCFCLFLIMYTSFIITTINQIKEHLHIRAFHIVSKTE